MPRLIDVIESFREGENANTSEAAEYIAEFLIGNEDVKVYSCTGSLADLINEKDRAKDVFELFNSFYWEDFSRIEIQVESVETAYSLRSTSQDVLILANRMMLETPKGAQSIINYVKLNFDIGQSVEEKGLPSLVSAKNLLISDDIIDGFKNKELIVQSNYTTDLLGILNLTINEFFNPRRSVDAKKDEITEWIKTKGKELKINVSDNVADSIFTIIKPNDHNPKIKRA